MPYSFGFNTPGYMPEMEPYMVEDADAAKRFLIEEMLRDADTVVNFGSTEALSEALTHEAEDLNLSDVSKGYSVIVCDPNRPGDLGTCYWIEPISVEDFNEWKEENDA